MTPKAQWSLARAPHGALYALVEPGDRVQLLFECDPGDHAAELLWVTVIETDRLGARRLAGTLLEQPERVPLARGAEVSFGMRHGVDWKRKGSATPLALLADWWRRRTHQTD